jgi:hypothetical protein
MAFDLENPIGTGTDQELLDFTRAAIAEITLHGFMRTGNGRTLTKENLKTLREQVDWLESRINSANNGPAINYAKRMRAS